MLNTIRPWLSIGDYLATRNLVLLQANQIGAILQLAEQVNHPQIITCYLPVEDGIALSPDLLRQGVDFVLAQQRQGQHVIIACGAGISRSAIFATAALKETEDITLLEAVQSVKLYHPDTLPHMALWASLCTYYHEAIPFLTMLRALKTVKREPGK
ncbi:hypothetical protein BH10CHL1_BH10CHL1_14420 [soil metagenome]